MPGLGELCLTCPFHLMPPLYLIQTDPVALNYKDRCESPPSCFNSKTRNSVFTELLCIGAIILVSLFHLSLSARDPTGFSGWFPAFDVVK